MKSFFKILLLIFVLQSTWAVSAQYCQNKSNLNIAYPGHPAQKHDAKDAENKNVVVQNPGNNSSNDKDVDCPYCNLGSMKSITNNLLLNLVAQFQHDINEDFHYSYPDIIPLKPERPNWYFAV